MGIIIDHANNGIAKTYSVDLFILRVVILRTRRARHVGIYFTTLGPPMCLYETYRNLPPPSLTIIFTSKFRTICPSVFHCFYLIFHSFFGLSRSTNNLSVCTPYFWVIIFIFVNLMPHRELNQRLLSGSWSTTPKHTGTT